MIKWCVFLLAVLISCTSTAPKCREFYLDGEHEYSCCGGYCVSPTSPTTLEERDIDNLLNIGAIRCK